MTAQRRRILIVMCLALATVVSAVSSLNVALPDMARDTGATPTQLQWVVDAYALVFAGLLLFAGALGDRVGRRRVLLGGLGIFGVGALAATTVDDPGALIAVRGVMGLGAALIMPTTLSIITSTFPPGERDRASTSSSPRPPCSAPCASSRREKTVSRRRSTSAGRCSRRLPSSRSSGPSSKDLSEAGPTR